VPVVFREAGLRFHFFSKEGVPLEPVHIHVSRGGGDAKLWLYPEVRPAYSRGLSARELRLAQAIVALRRREIEESWNAFFARTDEG
jgi:hypothetical protein